MEFLLVANGVPMFILCLIVVLVVLIQPTILTITARKRGEKIGLSKKVMNATMKSSAVFAILPSIPVLVSYLVLVPAQGKYFPWMRLSVVGSVTYETTVSTMAANTYGYDNIYNSDFPLDVFFSILLILTIGIIGGNIFNLFFLKSYEKNVKKMMNKNKLFLPVITGALSIAMFSVLATPTLTDLNQPVGIISCLAAGISSIFLEKAGKGRPKLAEYAFSISLLVGMVVSCLVNPFFSKPV
jgi:hypothetical protein